MKLGFRVLLQGAPGDGKTFSLNTLTKECDLNTFVVLLEPAEHVLESHPKMHYSYLSTYKKTWKQISVGAERIRKLSNAQLQITDGNKKDFLQFYELMEILNNFTDQRGESFGCSEEWGHNSVLVIDSLTGLTKITQTLAVGDKPCLTQPDYQVVMNTLAGLIDKLALDLTCHIVLIAHLASERDELTGAIKRMPWTFGQKLAPIIPKDFPDSVLAYRDGTKFRWSTLNDKYILKHALLPMSADQRPSFKPIYDGWKKRQEEEEKP